MGCELPCLQFAIHNLHVRNSCKTATGTLKEPLVQPTCCAPHCTLWLWGCCGVPSVQCICLLFLGHAFVVTFPTDQIALLNTKHGTNLTVQSCDYIVTSWQGAQHKITCSIMELRHLPNSYCAFRQVQRDGKSKAALSQASGLPALEHVKVITQQSQIPQHIARKPSTSEHSLYSKPHCNRMRHLTPHTHSKALATNPGKTVPCSGGPNPAENGMIGSLKRT